MSGVPEHKTYIDARAGDEVVGRIGNVEEIVYLHHYVDSRSDCIFGSDKRGDGCKALFTVRNVFFGNIVIADCGHDGDVGLASAADSTSGKETPSA